MQSHAFHLQHANTSLTNDAKLDVCHLCRCIVERYIAFSWHDIVRCSRDCHAANQHSVSPVYAVSCMAYTGVRQFSSVLATWSSSLLTRQVVPAVTTTHDISHYCSGSGLPCRGQPRAGSHSSTPLQRAACACCAAQCAAGRLRGQSAPRSLACKANTA
jgi:hypothetical protein